MLPLPWKVPCNWQFFLANPFDLRPIVFGQAPADKQSLFSLREHGFIVKEEDRYKMRVPIFEEWVRQFGDVVYAAP